MSIDKKTVEYVARQAHIDVSPEEAERLVPELNGIMNWIEQLSSLETEAVEPLANVADIKLSFREDKVNDGGKPADILKNAPEHTEGYFVVQKIVE